MLNSLDACSTAFWTAQSCKGSVSARCTHAPSENNAISASENVSKRELGTREGRQAGRQAEMQPKGSSNEAL